MAESLSKFFGTTSDSAGNPLHWIDPNDFPFRGQTPPPLLRKDEIESIPLVYEARSALLQLPQDQDKYNDVIDHCANGAWCLRHERFIEKEGSLYIFLSWLEIYRQTPSGDKQAWEQYRDAYREHD